MNEVTAVLKRAKAIIENPEHWGRWLSYNRDNDGNERWCAYGAVRAASEQSVLLMDYSLKLLNQHSHPFQNIIDANDCCDHTTVMQIFDAAIAEAEAV